MIRLLRRTRTEIDPDVLAQAIEATFRERYWMVVEVEKLERRLALPPPRDSLFTSIGQALAGSVASHYERIVRKP